MVQKDQRGVFRAYRIQYMLQYSILLSINTTYIPKMKELYRKIIEGFWDCHYKKHGIVLQARDFAGHQCYTHTKDKEIVQKCHRGGFRAYTIQYMLQQSILLSINTTYIHTKDEGIAQKDYRGAFRLLGHNTCYSIKIYGILLSINILHTYQR